MTLRILENLWSIFTVGAMAFVAGIYPGINDNKYVSVPLRIFCIVLIAFSVFAFLAHTMYDYVNLVF